MDFKASINRPFSSAVPMDIRMQLGQPKAFKFLTMTPFFNRDWVISNACVFVSQIDVIKLATDGTVSIPREVNSFCKNVYPVALMVNVFYRNAESSMAADPAVWAISEGEKGSFTFIKFRISSS